MNELDCVALTVDLPEHRLKRGDIGAIVLVYGESAGYEVEFVASDGSTVALITVSPSIVQFVEPGEVNRARSADPTQLPNLSHTPTNGSPSSAPEGSRRADPLPHVDAFRTTP